MTPESEARESANDSIVIAHFSNQFNAVVEAALSVARIAPLYSIRASAIDLRRIIVDNLSLLQ